QSVRVICMSQVPSSLPPCVPSMDAVLATMGSNAQATTKGAIMFLTNFIFISVISFIVLAFLGFPPWEVISGRSPEYRTETSARLRGKLGAAVISRLTLLHRILGWHGGCRE